MARIFCQSLLGLVILYALAVAGYAFFHYEGDRPSADVVLADFHAWVGIGSGRGGPPPPPHVPAPPPPAPPPKPPDPTPEPPKPTEDVASPEVTKQLDEIEASLKAAEQAARTLRDMTRGPGFDEQRGKILGATGQARETLGKILDGAPKLRRANELWDKTLQLHNAVSHL